MRLRLFCAGVVFYCSLPAAAAEVPAVERFLPAGAQRGTSVSCRVVGKSGDGNVHVHSSATGLTFAFSKKRDTVEVTVAADADVGVHWLRVANESGATELFPFLVGVIPEMSETEPNAKIADAGSLPGSSVTVNGVLEKANDVDTFAVDLAEGQTVVASQLASRILNSPMAGVLQIVDRRGTVVAQNDDDATMDPLVTFTAPTDGRWYVRTFAFPSAPNSTIGFAGGANYVYRLTVSTDGYLDHTTPLARQSGSLETRFSLHGWNLAATEAALPGTQRTLIGQFALPHLVHDIASPVIEEFLLGPDRRLTVPLAVSASISGLEEDRYFLTLDKAQKVTLVAETQRFGSLLDPVLQVEDAEGKVLKEADDLNNESPDAKLDFVAPAAGDFRVVVRDRFQSVSDRHFYLLRTEETQPEVRLSVKATSIRVVGTAASEVVLTVERSNGFAEPLSFRVEGLPDGVTFECPKSEKDGDSSKSVTLKIVSAQPLSWAGPVRIVSDSEVQSEPRDVVWRATDGTDLSRLWLTIVPE